MDGLEFTWDERKNLNNQEKHSVSFGEAQTVFYDEFARLIHDPEHSEDEDRFILLGFSNQIRMLVVCHCYREEEQLIRIISARKATKSEQKMYEGFRDER
ncbi:BrnT family toxin [Thiohalophilus sp.]|uniref:BrnT family toxin n=1 Tax=Thiohalophilus sp. TaxID=3028392 RepID=UPI002ACDF961|nr:BrnT family toxin [Thiohalophilus sp.]MDZ7661812.1 BrnT family toxin [Thiohalophilus sp.]